MEPAKKKQKIGGGSVTVPRESLMEACEMGAPEQEVRFLFAEGEVRLQSPGSAPLPHGLLDMR